MTHYLFVASDSGYRTHGPVDDGHGIVVPETAERFETKQELGKRVEEWRGNNG